MNAKRNNRSAFVLFWIIPFVKESYHIPSLLLTCVCVSWPDISVVACLKFKYIYVYIYILISQYKYFLSHCCIIYWFMDFRFDILSVMWAWAVIQFH